MGDNKHLDDLPQRGSTHDTEKAAINAFENAITEGKLFVVQQRGDTNDYGTDIQIEARIGPSMTNSRVHAQLKGTESKENSDGSVSIPVDRENLNYLLRQPLSVYICYHLPSDRLLVQTAEDTFQQYEQKGSDWQTQKSITIKFKENFSPAFQQKLHTLAVTTGKSSMEQRLQWVTASPEQIVKMLHAASGPIYLSGEPQRAYEILLGMFKAGQDDKISESFVQFEAVLGEFPAVVALAYMAEINLGINGYCFDEERVRKAIPLFESICSKLGDRRGDLTYCIGNAYSVLGDYQNALPSYLQAIEELPLPEASHEVAMCYKNMGAVHKALGNSDDERQAYEKALELDPNLPEAHFAMGGCLYNEGNYILALEHLDKIVWDVDSLARSVSVSAWRIPILFNLKDAAGAFREINTLLGQVNRFEWILPWCGRFVWQFGKESIDIIQKSLLFWKKYLLEFPEDIKGKREYLICLWRLHECSIRVDMDFSTFKREILALIEAGDPDPAFLWDRLGHWAQTEDKWEEAEDAYRKACEMEPDQYGYCLGTALNFREKYEEALPILLVQAEEYLPDSMSWFQVAVAREGTGDTVGCIAAYERALKLDPDYDLAWFNLGGVCWNSGDTPYALTIWKEAVTRFPDHDLADKLRQFLPSVFGKEN